ncbi:MAG TPA: DUF6286 domain-containing protein [Streptosporangiaceae bacterium]|nr:DUF6286 domain-containing protein [Streptosporangiaceae bacterium]
MTRRILSPLLAVVLVLLGAFFIAEAIPQLIGSDRPLGVDYYVVPAQLFHRAWDSPYVLGAGAALLAIGVFFLLLAASRGRRPLPLTSQTPDVRVELPRRDLRRIAEATAASLEDVTKVKASAQRQRVKVTARTYPQAPGDLAEQVRDLVSGQITTLAPARRSPRVRVRLKRKGNDRPHGGDGRIGGDGGRPQEQDSRGRDAGTSRR